MDQNMLEKFNTKLAQSFSFEKYNFHTLTILNENSKLAGFSIQKNLDKKYIKDDKKYISLIYIHTPQTENFHKENKKPITLRVNIALKENDKLLYENKYLRKKISGPINIESENEYFYDTEKNIFYDHKNKIYQADDFLLKIYKLHLKPTRFFSGFFLRLRLIKKQSAVFIINNLSFFLILILWILSGKKYSYNIDERHFSFKFDLDYDKKYEKKKEEVLDEKMDFFGNKISTRILMVYCSIHLIIYVTFYWLNFRPKIIIDIFTNNFLSVVYIILSLSILQFFQSKQFEKLIRNTTDLASKIKYQPTKV